jgi:hypothetical protein
MTKEVELRLEQMKLKDKALDAIDEYQKSMTDPGPATNLKIMHCILASAILYDGVTWDQYNAIESIINP